MYFYFYKAIVMLSVGLHIQLDVYLLRMTSSLYMGQIIKIKPNLTFLSLMFLVIMTFLPFYQ